MIINKVTFTGLDNNTNIEYLKNIQKKYPYVEWGVILSSTPGKGRQPSEEQILKLRDKGLNLSLHMCLDHAKNILTNGNIELKYKFFDRYQFNFNFNHTKHDINHYVKLINTYKDKQFILQSNFSNENYIEKIISSTNTSNTNILYDSSGGRGIEIKQIKAPYKGIYTGYCGGINEENIDDICKQITFHKNNDRIWLDIETGVRTDDIFDLDKVSSILKIINKHKTKGFTL